MRALIKSAAVGASAAWLFAQPSTALADPTGEAAVQGNTAYVRAQDQSQRPAPSSRRKPSEPRPPGNSDADNSNRSSDSTEQEPAWANAFEYGSTMDICQREILLAAISASCISQQAQTPARPVRASRAVPAISPQEAAQRAVARLTLTAPKPGIGPPPEINRWKMAAVGYPMWLWVEGNTNPAPVSDSVGGLFVSLDARIQQISFDMGDGHTVRCATAGTKWTRAVKPAQKSPTCGYTYQQPSLPKGEYTITATTTWAVDWNINGTTGTIPLTQSASTTLPVGELQALVR